MARVLILSFSEIKRDPRVVRQIQFLHRDHELLVAGYCTDDVSSEVVCIQSRKITLLEKLFAVAVLKLRMYEKFYWSRPEVKSALSKLSEKQFEVIVANDLSTLPLALKLASNKAKVVFDAHEYAPREFEDMWLWRFLYQGFVEYLCERYLNRTNAMTTVCNGIASMYDTMYGVLPVVVTNAADFVPLEPSCVGEKIRLIHHGAAIPSRHLDVMIKAMDFLGDEYELYFMLTGNQKYLEILKNMAKGDERIKFVSPVPMPDIPFEINQYDIGVFLLPPVNFNYEMALPNKLFEFIQARLAVVIGPSKEMKKIVLENDCGVVSEDFSAESFSETIKSLSKKDIEYYKSKSHLAAAEVNSAVNQKRLLDLLDRLLRQLSR